jgi:hypothetical protein
MDRSKLAAQWAVIISAPQPHIIAALVGLGIIWAVVAYSYSTILANKNSQIDLLKDRVASYESKLKVSSPEQAVGELQTIRDQLSDTRQQLAAIANPPRVQNGIYQRGRQIGIGVGERIDAVNKTVSFSQMTVGGDLDQASNIEYRNLVLFYTGSDSFTSARQGLVGTSIFYNAWFSIVGNRAD